MPISMANSSDPYVSTERDLRLTRETLSILLPRGYKVLIITKSDLVMRDISLIRKGNCSVSMTITTLNERVAKRLEPNAPLPERRIKAIKALSDAGIPCSVRIDPLIPGINDDGLEKLVKVVSEAGAKHIVASTYKAKVDSLNRLREAFPELATKLTELYLRKGRRIGRAWYLADGVRVGLLSSLKKLVEKFGMTFATCREGIPGLRSGLSCDGSHLIPVRQSVMTGSHQVMEAEEVAPSSSSRSG
jgi:DNA repair photolyase